MGRFDSFLRPLALLLALGLTLVGMVSSDQVWLLCMGAILICLLYLVWSLVPPAQVVRRTGGLVAGGNEPLNDERISRSVQMLGGFLLVGFLVLTFNLLRTQVAQADAIKTTQVVSETEALGDDYYRQDTAVIRSGVVETYTNVIQGTNVQTGTSVLQNPRILGSELRVERGNIFDAAGNVVAGRQVYTDTGYVQRTYPAPNISYLTGFYNPTIYGINGIESTYNDYLSGKTGTPEFITQQDELLHRPVVGQDVYLTIDPALQDVAAKALGERKGAVIVIDVQTGAIKAMVTYPHYDPNGLSFNPEADDWGLENSKIVNYWDSLVSGDQAADLPLLNRATRGLYPPGSTFKTVTLAAGLDLGKVRPDTIFTDTGKFQAEPGGYQHVDCSTCRPASFKGNLFTLMQGYQWSLNVVFAEMAVRDLGANELNQYAQAFGFGRSYDLGMPVDASRVGDTSDINNLAAASYGQGQMQATPLEMAMVAAAVGRTGDLPAPYIVDKVVNPETNQVLLQTQPKSLGRTVSQDTGNTLRQMMYTSVKDGWANPAAVPGFAVGGKTGTAETGTGTSHAWFIGIAGKDPNNPQYAICAMVEEGGEGSRVAAPIAKTVLAAALGASGQ